MKAPFFIINLSAAAAGFAIAAAFFALLPRRGKHLPAVAPFGGVAAVGAGNGLVVSFH